MNGPGHNVENMFCKLVLIWQVHDRWSVSTEITAGTVFCYSPVAGARPQGMYLLDASAFISSRRDNTNLSTSTTFVIRSVFDDQQGKPHSARSRHDKAAYMAVGFQRVLVNMARRFRRGTVLGPRGSESTSRYSSCESVVWAPLTIQDLSRILRECCESRPFAGDI